MINQGLNIFSTPNRKTLMLNLSNFKCRFSSLFFFGLNSAIPCEWNLGNFCSVKSK